MKWDWADGQICWSWCGTTPRFVARKDREGKGGWIKKRQGLGSLSFVLKFLRLPSPGRSRLLRGNNKGSGLVSSMAVMAAPLDDTKLSPVSRVGSTLSQVTPDTPCNFLSPLFSSALAQLTWRVFALAYRLIHTIRYFFVRDGWTRAPIREISLGLYVDDDGVVDGVPSFLKGFELRCRPSGEYVTTCFDMIDFVKLEPGLDS